ncbi:unnamed protein product [Amoebophrya sp. A120]|nr:unnamed protein product [Amoebophrya sp. A120]|eukprot:GSA120T00020314001.1
MRMPLLLLLLLFRLGLLSLGEAVRVKTEETQAPTESGDRSRPGGVLRVMSSAQQDVAAAALVNSVDTTYGLMRIMKLPHQQNFDDVDVEKAGTRLKLADVDELENPAAGDGRRSASLRRAVNDLNIMEEHEQDGSRQHLHQPAEFSGPAPEVRQGAPAPRPSRNSFAGASSLVSSKPTAGPRPAVAATSSGQNVLKSTEPRGGSAGVEIIFRRRDKSIEETLDRLVRRRQIALDVQQQQQEDNKVKYLDRRARDVGEADGGERPDAAVKHSGGGNDPSHQAEQEDRIKFAAGGEGKKAAERNTQVLLLAHDDQDVAVGQDLGGKNFEVQNRRGQSFDSSLQPSKNQTTSPTSHKSLRRDGSPAFLDQEIESHQSALLQGTASRSAAATRTSSTLVWLLFVCGLVVSMILVLRVQNKNFNPTALLLNTTPRWPTNLLPSWPLLRGTWKMTTEANGTGFFVASFREKGGQSPYTIHRNKQPDGAQQPVATQRREEDEDALLRTRASVSGRRRSRLANSTSKSRKMRRQNKAAPLVPERVSRATGAEKQGVAAGSRANITPSCSLLCATKEYEHGDYDGLRSLRLLSSPALQVGGRRQVCRLQGEIVALPETGISIAEHSTSGDLFGKTRAAPFFDEDAAQQAICSPFTETACLFWEASIIQEGGAGGFEVGSRSLCQRHACVSGGFGIRLANSEKVVLVSETDAVCLMVEQMRFSERIPPHSSHSRGPGAMAARSAPLVAPRTKAAHGRVLPTEQTAPEQHAYGATSLVLRPAFRPAVREVLDLDAVRWKREREELRGPHDVDKTRTPFSTTTTVPSNCISTTSREVLEARARGFFQFADAPFRSQPRGRNLCRYYDDGVHEEIDLYEDDRECESEQRAASLPRVETGFQDCNAAQFYAQGHQLLTETERARGEQLFGQEFQNGATLLLKEQCLCAGMTVTAVGEVRTLNNGQLGLFGVRPEDISSLRGPYRDECNTSADVHDTANHPTTSTTTRTSSAADLTSWERDLLLRNCCVRKDAAGLLKNYGEERQRRRILLSDRQDFHSDVEHARRVNTTSGLSVSSRVASSRNNEQKRGGPQKNTTKSGADRLEQLSQPSRTISTNTTAKGGQVEAPAGGGGEKPVPGVHIQQTNPTLGRQFFL